MSVPVEYVTSWVAAGGALLPLPTLATFAAEVATDVLPLDAALFVFRIYFALLAAAHVEPWF